MEFGLGFVDLSNAFCDLNMGKSFLRYAYNSPIHFYSKYKFAKWWVFAQSVTYARIALVRFKRLMVELEYFI